MYLASWTALLAGSVLCGAAVVGAMVSPRKRQLAAALLTLPAFAMAGAGIVGVALRTARVDESVVAGFLAVGAFVGGFALGGATLTRLGAELPAATLPDIVPHDDAGRTGVVVLACAEPPVYQPAAVARMLELLQDAEVSLPPEFARVFVYASEKARYRLAGGSPARRTCEEVTARVDDILGADARFAPPSVAWCDDEPTLDRSVADLVTQGVRDIVIAHLGVAEDTAAVRAKRRVDALRVQEHGVRLSYAPPLWSSGVLAERVATRVIDTAGEAPAADLGVALIGHGQPVEFDRINPVMTEHETLFHQRVRAELVERGVDGGRIRLGWLEWLEPGVTEVVRHLAALGASKIIVVPSAMPADTLTTLLDIRDSVARSRVEGSADIVIMPAWGDDPVVAEVLAANVREATNELA